MAHPFPDGLSPLQTPGQPVLHQSPISMEMVFPKLESSQTTSAQDSVKFQFGMQTEPPVPVGQRAFSPAIPGYLTKLRQCLLMLIIMAKRKSSGVRAQPRLMVPPLSTLMIV